jgi:hypothetical protein
MSVRAFNSSRAIRAIAAVLMTGAVVAFVLRLCVRALHGRGLEPYFSSWGLETTPVQALIGVGVSTLILGIAELARWLRGSRTLGGRRHHRARGPIRARPSEPRFPV